jgi:hypothetical protein
MDDWLRLLQSGVDDDKERCTRYSLKLRYLTGEESEVSSPSLRSLKSFTAYILDFLISDTRNL